MTPYDARNYQPRGYPMLGYHLGQYAFNTGATGSITWSANNRAVFMPFEILEPTLISKIGVMGGATASGNFDVGIYAPDDNDPTNATLLVSGGGAAMSGANQRQNADIADTMLGRGTYYFAVALSSTVGTVWGVTLTAAALGAAYGFGVMESAYPLPAAATLVTFTGTTVPFWFAWDASLTAP